MQFVAAGGNRGRRSVTRCGAKQASGETCDARENRDRFVRARCESEKARAARYSPGRGSADCDRRCCARSNQAAVQSESTIRWIAGERPMSVRRGGREINRREGACLGSVIDHRKRLANRGCETGEQIEVERAAQGG